METPSIESDDLTLSQVFQSFYRVPDYQREYIWGDAGAKGDRGDEVEQFLRDIYGEFEQATAQNAPEYFIGTIVVCGDQDGIFDLIDGQQRTTTAFLTLCALRDAYRDAECDVPSTLLAQIADGDTNWKGETVHRIRLDLQYEDASGILGEYGNGNIPLSSRDETRSIRNIVNAYETISEFLRVTFDSDIANLRAFYGYFTNKVKLIRIETPTVSRALKIFETINDRGVGLDAMDLLKNLLFMSANVSDFGKLKDIWKEVTQEIYDAHEKPLRFLRYFLLANFDVDPRIREEEIYDWLVRNSRKTGHANNPIAFAKKLRESASTYHRFVLGQDKHGQRQISIENTRALGGSAIKQHFVLLLAGKDLRPALFSRLCRHIENLMFVWLISGVPAKEYDRLIAQGARAVRSVRTEAEFQKFEKDFVRSELSRNRESFRETLLSMCSWNLRKFRLKYLFAKITQAVDVDAYGQGGHSDLRFYLESENDIEHILSQSPSKEALKEFGNLPDDDDWVESLGNLMWLEKSINRAVGNQSYSKKAGSYESSKFLLAKCQARAIFVGKNDRITRATRKLCISPEWNVEAIEARQEWIADKALEVWEL